MPYLFPHGFFLNVCENEFGYKSRFALWLLVLEDLNCCKCDWFHNFNYREHNVKNTNLLKKTSFKMVQTGFESSQNCYLSSQNMLFKNFSEALYTASCLFTSKYLVQKCEFHSQTPAMFCLPKKPVVKLSKNPFLIHKTFTYQIVLFLSGMWPKR